MYMYYFAHCIQYPLRTDTMSYQAEHLNTHRKSRQNIESTLVLTAPSHLHRSVFEASNKKNNL
jgi:hypothetical protein